MNDISRDFVIKTYSAHNHKIKKEIRNILQKKHLEDFGTPKRNLYNYEMGFDMLTTDGVITNYGREPQYVALTIRQLLKYVDSRYWPPEDNTPMPVGHICLYIRYANCLSHDIEASKADWLHHLGHNFSDANTRFKNLRNRTICI
jgi:hypothetical protein